MNIIVNIYQKDLKCFQVVHLQVVVVVYRKLDVNVVKESGSNVNLKNMSVYVNHLGLASVSEERKAPMHVSYI